MSCYNDSFIQNLYLHIKEEHPHSPYVSSLSRQHITMLIADKPVKQSEFRKSSLFAVIGITFLILIVIMIHLWLNFKDRKKKKRNERDTLVHVMKLAICICLWTPRTRIYCKKTIKKKGVNIF